MHYMPEGSYDHCPGLLHFQKDGERKRKSFQFYDMWCSHPQFEEVVENSWQEACVGTPMLKVASKLKRLKRVLKDLDKRHYSNIEQRYFEAKYLLEKN